MVMIERDPYTEHVKNVKALAAVGISPPAEWTAMHQRLTDYLGLNTPVRAQLIDAIGEGKGDIAALRAGAYAEAAVSPQTNKAVVSGVHNKLLQVYAGHGKKELRPAGRRIQPVRTGIRRHHRHRQPGH